MISMHSLCILGQGQSIGLERRQQAQMSILDFKEIIETSVASPTESQHSLPSKSSSINTEEKVRGTDTKNVAISKRS